MVRLGVRGTLWGTLWYGWGVRLEDSLVTDVRVHHLQRLADGQRDGRGRRHAGIGLQIHRLLQDLTVVLLVNGHKGEFK